MLLKFFNRNQPLLSFSFVILTAIAYFFMPENPDSKWFLWFNHNKSSLISYKALYLFLFFICAQLVTLFINQSGWLKNGFSYLPGLVLLILGFAFPNIFTLETLLLSIIIIVCQFIFSHSLGKQKQIKRSFQLGVLIGIGVLIDLYFMVFGITTIIFWHYLRSYYWRETVWFLIGILIPSYFLAAVFYILNLPLKNIFILSIESKLIFPPAIMVAKTFTVILTIFGIINLYKRATRNTLRSRQLASFFMGSLIATSIYLLINRLISGYYINLGLLAFPIAAFISVLFFNPSKVRLANLVFYLWAVLLIAVGLGIF